MAINRTETVQQVNVKIVPTVFTATHRGLLNVDIIDSLVFRKDVIDSQIPVGGSEVVDFSDKDLATITVTVNTSISFANIPDGDTKYLELTKNAGNLISFTGSIDVSQRKDYINTTSTFIVYEVIRKGLVLYVNSINIDKDRELNRLTGEVLKQTIEYTGWNMDTTSFVSMILPDEITFDKFISAEISIKSSFSNKLYPFLSGFVDVGGSTGFGGSYTASFYTSGPNVGKSVLFLYRGPDSTSAFDSSSFTNATAYIFVKYRQ